MEYDYCITGDLNRDLNRELRDKDFFHDTIVEGRKRRLVGAELEIRARQVR